MSREQLTQSLGLDAGRIEKCQALFAECLRRYSSQAEEADKPYTPEGIVKMSLVTLQKNGFSAEEILVALS